MLAPRALATLGLAIVVLVPACGPRVVAWNTALADTDCHASDTIVRKHKGEPGKFLVTACGEELTYRCDPAANTCVVDTSAPPLAPLSPAIDDPEATPLDPALDGAPPRDEAESDDATPDELPTDDTPTSDAPGSDAAVEDADSAGSVPEPPAG